MGELAKIESFRKQLAVVETFEEIKLIGDSAEVYQQLMKKQKVSRDAQNEIAEFIIEVEEKKGEYLDKNHPHGKDHTSKVAKENLACMPASKKESIRARTIRNADKKKKEDIKNKIKKSGDVITPNKLFNELKKREKRDARDLLYEVGKSKNVDIDFRLGDFEQVFNDIGNASVDCIITDPPYPLEFIDCWSKLGVFAKRVLKPNGFCIAYSGQYNLPEVITRMNEHLTYYWTFALYHEGCTQIVSGVNLICRWKPILIYQNGRKKVDHPFQDFVTSDTRQKDGHDWQQGESGVSYLIEMFTNPGELIVDPFAGSGTTLIAGKKSNRNVIGAEIDEYTYNIAKSKL